jgi:superfamily II DNA or RNA helicase
MSEFQPSNYQKAVFDWIENKNGHAVIEAVAGSGKTTTLVQCAKLIDSSRCLFLAFNDHIVKELKQKFDSSVSIKTIHSVGFSACTSLAEKKLTSPEKNL